MSRGRFADERGERQLVQAEARIEELMGWFAEQRLLELDPSVPYQRPGVRESLGYVASRAASAVRAVPGMVRPGRGDADDDERSLSAGPGIELESPADDAAASADNRVDP